MKEKPSLYFIYNKIIDQHADKYSVFKSCMYILFVL